jgi:glycosyltransferase involved in cell wall biosynthesis
MQKPLVSVYIPNYNHGRFLAMCFGGLLGQTYENLEVIVTDDGSTDGSREIIEKYARDDKRVKAKFFPENRGIAAAFQDLGSRASGKYIYSGAADDFVVNKDFFAKAVAALESDLRPAGFYGLAGIYHNEKNSLVEMCGTAEVEGYNTPLQCCQGFLKCRSVVMSTSCVWRRDLFEKHGGSRLAELTKRFGPQVDFYLSHTLAFTYGMAYEKVPLACQRIFEARTNFSANMHLWEAAARFGELEAGLREVGLSYPEMEDDWLRWRAYWMVDTIKKSGVRI